MNIKLADMQKPEGISESNSLNYYDGSSRTVYSSDIERPFPDGKLIVSRTDLEGTITHANDAFVEISGYTREELIGESHYILRHPDMPKAAYTDLWQTIKLGNKWHGYVKNLCKDGSHYWVFATIVPNVRKGETVSYTSVRRKPSRKKIEQAIEQYKQLLSGEKS